MFARFFLKSRLKRIERRLKTLHARQKRVRERIDEASKAVKAGEKGAPERLAGFESKRELLVREVAALTDEERRLKAEL